MMPEDEAREMVSIALIDDKPGHYEDAFAGILMLMQVYGDKDNQEAAQYLTKVMGRVVDDPRIDAMVASVETDATELRKQWRNRHGH